MNWKKSKDAAAKADPGAEKAAPGAGGPAAFVKKNWKWLVPVVCVVALGGWFILRPSPEHQCGHQLCADHAGEAGRDEHPQRHRHPEPGQYL